MPSDAAPIDADHSIWQFKTGEEEGYNLVSTALKNLIEKEIGAGTSGVSVVMNKAEKDLLTQS